MSQASSFQRELDAVLACPELTRVTALLNVALVDVERGNLGLAEAEDVAVKHGLADVLGTCGLGVARNPVRFLLLACREERGGQQWGSRALANLYFALTGSELARTRIGQVRSFLESLEPELSVEVAPAEVALAEVALAEVAPAEVALAEVALAEVALAEVAPPPPHVYRPYLPYHPVTRADLTRAAEYVRGQH